MSAEPLPLETRLRGGFTRVGPCEFEGHAHDPAHPGERLVVEILADGRHVAARIADEFRAQLIAAGLGDGGHGFSFLAFPALLERAARIEARLANLGVVIGEAIDLSSPLADDGRPREKDSPPPQAAAGRVVLILGEEGAEATLLGLDDALAGPWTAAVLPETSPGGFDPADLALVLADPDFDEAMVVVALSGTLFAPGGLSGPVPPEPSPGRWFVASIAVLRGATQARDFAGLERAAHAAHRPSPRSGA